MNLEAHVREQLKRNDRTILLMTHVIVGYPSLEANWRMLEIMADCGVDLVELQMPFSEPVADGPTFVRANQLALERGLRLDDYFSLMERATASFPFPHLMMGYYNTVFKLGHALFCERLSGAGGVGYILPDLPFEQYGDLSEHSTAAELTPILFMTPTNTRQRLGEVGEHAAGFVYAVARKGVTGLKTELAENLFGFLEQCRVATDLPLAVGFGLRGADDLRLLHGRVEIGIVGSALLDVWEQQGEEGYRRFLGDLVSGRS